MNASKYAVTLLCATALCGAWASQALAQQTDAEVLGEVVVTATRQTDTVSRVPLSITAQTQKTLDQQGIKSVSDLARTVPALTVSQPQAGVATYTVRGISTTTGAATTGLYLDDTPLQKRNITCANFTTCANGTPAPILFDLERVEVLRGPQGTLYGGSSQGGTIRFITPQPSLTKYSVYARTEVGSTDYGSASYEAGVGVGGPIVQDKLGFRVSAFQRHNGGWIDYLNPYAGGAVRYKDANSDDQTAIRATLTWAPTPDLKITPAFYSSLVNARDANNNFNLPYAGTITTPQVCYNATTGNPPASTPCAPGVRYTRPAQTYGPFPYLNSPYNFINTWRLNPAATRLNVGSLSIDYNVAGVNVHSATSFIQDETSNLTYEAAQISNQQQTSQYPFAGGELLYSFNPDYAGPFVNRNHREGLIEEVRLSSIPSASPLSWVGGLYYSRIRNRSKYALIENTNAYAQQLFSITDTQRYGIGRLPNDEVSHRDQVLIDTEMAAFGEANYLIGNKLKLIAGVRVSQAKFDYRQVFYGQVSGFNDPTILNAAGLPQGITSGSVKQTPVTPRFGIQYLINGTDMVYANAAKGFRAGGVNSPLSPGLCGAGLAAVGLTTADVPKTYDSDSVWSYEAGAKFRLLQNRLQINSSIYLIDWTGVQLTVGVAGCGQTWQQNAGAAQSKGFDLQMQGRIIGGLSSNFAVGYDDAHYTASAAGPKPLSGAAATPVVQRGDLLPVAPWNVSLGLQYDFTVREHSMFIRGDYQYASPYYRTFGFGVSTYNPDTRQAAASRIFNARAGINFHQVDATIFVNNVFNSRDPLTVSGGRTGCNLAGTAACDGSTASGGTVTGSRFSNYQPLVTEQSFRPRTIGVQLTYRY